MSAVLFGSISTIADTSELQREAFNEAFEQAGLDWSWGRDEYAEMLEGSGGAGRIADYAKEQGVDVDADAIHAAKSELFQGKLASSDISPRDGVLETVREGKAAGFKIGLVTTTAEANVDALLAALAPELGPDAFDVLVDSDDVSAPKPEDAAYRFALEQLGEAPANCVAIEDNRGGVHAATTAGLPCVAFPNVNTAGHSFLEADRTVDRVSFAELRALIPGA